MFTSWHDTNNTSHPLETNIFESIYQYMYSMSSSVPCNLPILAGAQCIMNIDDNRAVELAYRLQNYEIT